MKGTCKLHGEFELEKGCDQCLATKLAGQLKVKLDGEETNIVKVRYYSETTGEVSGREYTYFSAEQLKVGDIVIVPVRDTTGKAMVTAINVPDSEIAAFKDKVKTILKSKDESRQLSPEAYRFPSPLEKTEPTIPEGKPGDDWKEIKPLGPFTNTLDGEGIFFDKPDNPLPYVTDELLNQTSTELAWSTSPGADAEVLSHYNESLRVLHYAEERVIATAEDNASANDDLSLIGKLKKAMESKKREYLDPLKVQSDAIRETYNLLMEPVLKADKITRDKMLGYYNEQKRVAYERDEIERKRREAAEAEARLNNQPAPETPVVTMYVPPAKVRTDMGTSGARDHWVYEIVDINLLPRECMMPDAVLLNHIATKYHDQKKVPGVVFSNKPVIATRAR